jgi:single-strand DNA-binding protein
VSQQINQVVIAGNLTRDPELRQTGGGTPVCSLRIANNRRAKIADEWTDRPGYYDVTVWGNQGENCAQYLERGRGVLVSGELRWREWEDKDGNKRQNVEINAREVQFLPGRDGGGAPRSDVPADTAGLPPRQPAPAAASSPGADDDIPF